MADPSGSGSRRLACFIEEDDGLASLVDMEAGFSGNQPHTNNVHHYLPFFSKSLCYGRKNSIRAISSPSTSSSSSSFLSFSPRSVRFYDARFEDHHHHHHQPHFLDSCFLCKKPLGDNRDIFMYRGDTPFCSEECRQEQIEMDEAKEKKWSSSSIKGLKKKEQNKSSISPTKSQNYPSRTGTVAAA